MDRKTWRKPELIVLTRYVPQEAVLAVCKHGAISGQPYNLNTGCFAEPECHYTCEAILTS